MQNSQPIESNPLSETVNEVMKKAKENKDITISNTGEPTKGMSRIKAFEIAGCVMAGLLVANKHEANLQTVKADLKELAGQIEKDMEA